MKKLLSNQIKKKSLDVIVDDTYGKVKLEPFFHCDSRAVEVEFKIGVEHMYVLKDIFQLDSNIEKSEDYSYGSKLQFVHTLEAFEPKSRPLVQFARSWVLRNKDNYIKETYQGFTRTTTIKKLRNVPLHARDLEEILDALSGNSVIKGYVEDSNIVSWKVSGQRPPRRMTIKGADDGIEVSTNDLFGYACESENIYFHEGNIYRELYSEVKEIAEFIKCMDVLPDHTVFIQREDVPVFCRELLPYLEQSYEVDKKDFAEDEYELVPASFEIYIDLPKDDVVTCKVLAVYGESKFNIFQETKDILVRDQVKEAQVKTLVSSFCNFFDDRENLLVTKHDDNAIYELLITGIPKMQEVAQVYISDKLKHFNVIRAPRVSVGVSVVGNSLELEMISNDMSKAQFYEVLTRYNPKMKFYRMKNGDFVNLEGGDFDSILELKENLNLSSAQLKQDIITLPRYRAMYLDSALKERDSISINKDNGFKDLISNMKIIDDNDFEIPKSLDNVLREYQKRGFRWIKGLEVNGFGGILADDMGLGKTLQVITFLLAEFEGSKADDNTRALIVCPASLVFNWNNEISRFAPVLPVKMIVGNADERQASIKSAGHKDILITSYDLLKRDIEAYNSMHFYCQVIDESQYIKNSNTQASKAVKLINADFKLALTGTPIENRLSELWSVFDYLMPGYLFSYKRFRNDFEIPIVQDRDKESMGRLQKMISPFVLRRLKKDVLTDLPDKLEETIYANIEGEQQELYDANVKKMQLMLKGQSDESFNQSKIQYLAELTKLRQICCDPALIYDDYHAGSAKLDVCIELIRNATNSGHKILLFSQFTTMLDRIQRELKRAKISFYSLTGSTSKENRIKLVDQFNNDGTQVFCISLKAGGTGLNLTAADIVIHYDPWWNYAVQNQATDRAHRIGQKNVVTVYKLIVKDTIEEKILEIQDKKKELADQVLSGDGMDVSRLTREELLGLLM